MTRSFAYGILAALALSVAALGSAKTPELTTLPAVAVGQTTPPTIVTVDWTQPVGRANRAIFSIQGYPQVHTQENPAVEEAFLRLNPQGTQARLEHWIHLMEPENDNDDPKVFNWDAIESEHMIRFIDDSDTFLRRVRELGMEPLVLLGYTANWLNKKAGGNSVDDPREWAEFAAAVVETYAGRRRWNEVERLPVRYLQIWNEPNFDFWGGTDEEFFELFNVAASRLKRDYPGVMIGGPTLTGATAYHGKDPSEYLKAFLAACGANTDYVIFHHYGPEAEGTRVLFENLDRYLAMFRAVPGKERGKLMMTELDAWYSGPAKMRYLMDRQFGFIDRADDLIAIHQFCAMAYNESGNHTFGTIDSVGGVLPSVYWPYWLFRNWIGDLSYVQVEPPAGEVSGLRVTATHHTNEAGADLSTAILYNPTDAPIHYWLFLFAEPTEKARVLSIETLDAATLQPTLSAVPWPQITGRQNVTGELWLRPGEAVAVTLRDSGRRHFPFADLDNQETPWLSLASDKNEIGFRDEVVVSGEIVNTLLEPLTGTLSLVGVPEGWTATLEEGNSPEIAELTFGARRQVKFHIRADRLIPDRLVGLTLQFESVHGAAKCVAQTLRFARTLEEFVYPEVVMAARGETNFVGLQLRNLSVGEVTCHVAVEWDDASGIQPGDSAFDVELGGLSTHRIEHSFKIAPDAKPSPRNGRFRIEYLGAESTQEFRVAITEETALPDHRFFIIDLSPYLNYDPVAYSEKRDAVSETMGMFAFPGDYLPSGEIARAYGIPHQFTGLRSPTGPVTMLPQGQRIVVPPGTYDTLYLLGFGHDGKHPGTWTLHYADGTSEKVESEIPEWCSPPPPGARRAFSAPHRYLPAGISEPPCELWQWPIAINATKTLTDIEFPRFDRAAHIFAATLRRAP